MNRENRHGQQNRLKWWWVLIFAGVVAVFFYMLFSVTLPKYTDASTPEEIAQADLSHEYICLTAAVAEAYPGKLYEPADFSKEPLTAGDPNAKFQTYRIVLPLKAGITYGISGQTATYAQRVYVNGELLSAVETVSDRAEGFTPKTDLYTVFFTPQSDETEIAVQHAWFNHARRFSQNLSGTAAGHHPYGEGADHLRRSDRGFAAGDGGVLLRDVLVQPFQPGDAVVFPVEPVRGGQLSDL